jgi:hypothetical protein
MLALPEHRQEPPRPDRASFKPERERFRRGATRVERLGEREMAAAVEAASAAEHHCKTGHEESRTHRAPRCRISRTKGTEVKQTCFVITIDIGREVAVRCHGHQQLGLSTSRADCGDTVAILRWPAGPPTPPPRPASSDRAPSSPWRGCLRHRRGSPARSSCCWSSRDCRKR